ncbi:hypothetical protein [Bacillus suaedae]|uniref:Uncharacterized protein n=1 Tax=Halalkalibacter suaedae TaxID=2822140 RepID=A0A940WZA1_9BACI|nr:hypothetical protein [Bacillus suaedae]MBP3953632.1 hypothetical protein [Bacillus suaedae]
MKRLNPMLNEQRRPRKPSINRKTRSDKKVDIRVPITDQDREFILWNARSRRMSMTAFCTEIIQIQIQRNQEFHPRPYEHTDFIVHVKADEELYRHIVNYSIKWSCSIREATHRILTDSIFFIKGGVHVEGVQ